MTGVPDINSNISIYLSTALLPPVLTHCNFTFKHNHSNTSSRTISLFLHYICEPISRLMSETSFSTIHPEQVVKTVDRVCNPVTHLA